MIDSTINIIPFHKKYAADFARLNFEWLEKYFYVENYDREVLTNPEKYIINQGGHILFVTLNEEVIGTAALIRREEGVYELSKMGVTTQHQGKKIGQQLIYACIDFAKEIGSKRLFLDSSRKLTPAITLYHKVGFKEIPVPKDTPYERCDIRMEMHF